MDQEEEQKKRSVEEDNNGKADKEEEEEKQGEGSRSYDTEDAEYYLCVMMSNLTHHRFLSISIYLETVQ